ncbi:MAG: FAD binding domain-containing protein, partial [Actinomycetospora chiangmaiensis]|nr:FAD binding domain-containing protein [Actinomycetospora chiangmaiensis]
MILFDYTRASTVADALAAARQPGAAFLAAGTNLVDLMKGGVTNPERVIDIT